MSESGKIFWLGVFIIITLAVAAWLLLFLRPSVGNGGQTLQVRFANIQGVSIGTRVNYAGKPVGEVHKIAEIPNLRSIPPSASGNFYVYQLDLKVDSSVKVFTYDEIYFTTAGLLGEKSIAIIPKPTPAGSPPAQNITNKILYARSSDSIEEAMGKLTDVAAVMESAMCRINEFLDMNMQPFHETLLSLGSASTSLNSFLEQANNLQIAKKTSTALDTLSHAGSQADQLLRDLNRSGFIAKLTTGEGSFAKMLNSDCFYLQLRNVLYKMDTTLNDINNYGLLFQYDKTWQRRRLMKEMQMKRICSLSEAMLFFNAQIAEVENTLNRVDRLVYQFECPTTDPCIIQGYRELMDRVENLQQSLRNYSERMFNDCCRK